MDPTSWVSLYIIESKKNNQNILVRSGWPDRSEMTVVLVLGMCHSSRALGRLNVELKPWL